MLDLALSPQQRQVISALSDGANMTDAAALAGVHRNTVANWHRNFLPFGEALAHAQYDRAMLFREKAEAMADLSFETLQAILIDPNASPATRAKVAMFIIEMASTPPEPKKQVMLDLPKIHTPATQSGAMPPECEIARPVHKTAQSERPPVAPTPVETIRRDHPKVGRNETCPCGSGLKYKRCCLNKPQPITRPQAA